MTPAEIIIRKGDAALVHELLDKCIQLETVDTRADYEKAEKWFSKKHGVEWRSCIEARKAIVR